MNHSASTIHHRPSTRATARRREPAGPAFACRRCAARVPAGPLAVMAGSGHGLLIDRACDACGHRALYRASEAV